MALADITLTDATPTDRVFTFVEMQGNRVIRKDLARAPEIPLVLTFAHQASTIKGAKGFSHLMRLDQTTLDADGVSSYTNNVRVCVDIVNAVLSDTNIDHLRAMIIDCIGTVDEFRAFCKGSVR